MLFNLSEKQVIIILNCLNVTLQNLYNSKICESYFNRNNYDNDLSDIMLLHRIISLKANKDMYGLHDEVFFEGQRKYLINNRSFKILKSKEKKLRINFFIKRLDKYKKVV